MAESLLRLEKVVKNFGGLTALNRVSFSVRQGSITALIGPNGAGKTTAFNLITGVYAPSGGEIHLDGRRVDGLAVHRLARLGLARTFQTVKLFAPMTVLENVMVGCHASLRGGLLRCCFPLGRIRSAEEEARRQALGCLELVGLLDRRDLPAGELPFGLQRLLEIARALAAKPRLLLLDEPAAGLNGAERARLKELIKALRRGGMTVVLIEHDMNMIMDLADEVVVLEYGSVLAKGTPEEIRSDPGVIRAYLGG
ncbi:MAG: ABC transporter ATP-binding protein [Patescibacteria group bacterium]